ncbi:MAG: tetratricopeptide repeat protein [Pseudobdellovibrio sp.]
MYKLIIAAFLAFNLFGCGTTSTSEDKKETASLHLEIANEYIKGENYPLALKELLVAQDISPENPTVQANLGLVYFMRERYELAEKHYKKAIQLKPDFTDAKNNLGRVYVEIGQFKQAETMLNEVIQDLTYIDFPKAYANYGILEFRRKKYTEAISYLKKSLERDRENCFTHVYLGRSYLELKETALAVSQLEKTLPFCQLIESDEGLYYSAIALYRNNQKDKAKFRFEDLIKTYPSGYNNEKAQKMLQLIKKGT